MVLDTDRILWDKTQTLDDPPWEDLVRELLY